MRSRTKHPFDLSGHDASAFRRVAWGTDLNSALVATSSSVHALDLRAPSNASPFFTAGLNQLMTSIEAPDTARNLMCFCTTTQLVWLDPRNTRRPVLGWKHGRDRDRTLVARTLVRHLPCAPSAVPPASISLTRMRSAARRAVLARDRARVAVRRRSAVPQRPHAHVRSAHRAVRRAGRAARTRVRGERARRR